MAWLLAASALACGGGGESTRTAEPVPEPTLAAGTGEGTAAEPARPVHEINHTYYNLFWREIHVASIYLGAGPIRSEEPHNPDAVFMGHCDYMHIISHYYEHEPELFELVQQAHSLDEFFALVNADPDYRVAEASLEEGY